MSLFVYVTYSSIYISSGNSEKVESVSVKSVTPFEPFFKILKNKAPPSTVQAIGLKCWLTWCSLMRLIEELKIMGYRNVRVLTSEIISLQLMVKENCLRFKEGEYLLYNGERLFKYVNGILQYQNSSMELSKIRELTGEHFRYALFPSNSSFRSYNSNDFPNTEQITRNACLTSDDIVQTAILTLTRTLEKTSHVLVQDYTLTGPRITCDDKCILEKKLEGVPLPFEWTSEWGQVTTATLEINQWKSTITAPKNQHCRIVLKLDSNGIPDFHFESMNNPKVNLSIKNDSANFKGAVFISLDDESFLVLKDGKTFKESNVSDAIAMLDSEAPQRNNWMRYSTNSTTEYLTSYLSEDGTCQALSATTLMSQLFKRAIEEFGDERQELVLVVPSSFNERQRTALLKAGKEICDHVFLVDKLETLLTGMAVKQNLLAGDKMIILNGQSLVVAEFNANDVKLLCEQKDIDFLGEITSQMNADIINNQNASNSDGSNQPALPRPVLEQLRKCLIEVCGRSKTRTDEVKMVLLPTECVYASFLSDMLSWMFPAAVVTTVSNSVFSKLAADGGNCKKMNLFW